MTLKNSTPILHDGPPAVISAAYLSYVQHEQAQLRELRRAELRDELVALRARLDETHARLTELYNAIADLED